MPADDPRDLVAEAKGHHVERPAGWSMGVYEQHARCVTCTDRWPCLTARLAAQLERALDRVDGAEALVKEMAGEHFGQHLLDTAWCSECRHLHGHDIRCSRAALDGPAGEQP